MERGIENHKMYNLTGSYSNYDKERKANAVILNSKKHLEFLQDKEVLKKQKTI